MRGKGENRIITAEKVYDIPNETVIHYDWEQQIILSIPKIKSLLYKAPEKMEDIMEQIEIYGSR